MTCKSIKSLSVLQKLALMHGYSHVERFKLKRNSFGLKFFIDNSKKDTLFALYLPGLYQREVMFKLGPFDVAESIDDDAIFDAMSSLASHCWLSIGNKIIWPKGKSKEEMLVDIDLNV